MTDQTNNPKNSEEEEKKQPEDALSSVRQSLIEAEEQAEKAPQKKNILSAMKNIQITKLFKKKGKEISEDASDKPDSHPSDDDALAERMFSQKEKKQEVEPELDINASVEKLYEELTDEADDEDIEIEEEEEEEEIEEDIEESDVYLEEGAVETEHKKSEPLVEDKKPETPKLKPTSSKGKDIDNIRGVALEDYTEAPATEVNELQEAWRSFSRTPFTRMRLIERFAIVFLALLSVSLFLWIGVQSSGVLEPPPARPTNTPDPSIPVPTNVELPGGWSFNLKKGHLDAEGQWNPFGSEWLEGTEICRWVALPWSTQLEAVIQTLEADDPIKVTMSNLDVLTYYVQSRYEVDPAQTKELNLDVPSILIILSQGDAEQRWILTAVLNPEE